MVSFYKEVLIVSLNLMEARNVNELQDLTHLEFTLSMNGSGSAGSFYKAFDGEYYYKLSYLIGDRFCYEAVNEVLASRLGGLLGFNTLEYTLVYGKIKILSREYITCLCKSRNYKSIGFNRTTLESYCKLMGIDHSSIINLASSAFYNDLLDMLCIDYLVDNRDRHGANIELLMKGTDVFLAPIYDMGSSLLAPAQYDKDRIECLNYLHDGPVNNYLISIMWCDVLQELKSIGYRIPSVDVSKLEYRDLYCAFGEEYTFILDKEIEMIKERYTYAKKVLNS